MDKYHIELKLSLGGYNMATVGMETDDSFDKCRQYIRDELKRIVEDSDGKFIPDGNILSVIGCRKSDLI